MGFVLRFSSDLAKNWYYFPVASRAALEGGGSFHICLSKTILSVVVKTLLHRKHGTGLWRGEQRGQMVGPAQGEAPAETMTHHPANCSSQDVFRTLSPPDKKLVLW